MQNFVLNRYAGLHCNDVENRIKSLLITNRSPDLTITLSTEGTLDYSGDMQISYCSPDKELYTIVMCGDDDEE